MQKTEHNLSILNGVFLTSLITSNVISSKIVAVGSITVPAAVVAYPLTFLMTDVVGEIWGKQEANRTVRLGFFCQILSLILIGLALLLPVAPFADNQAEFKSILGSTFRIVGASMLSYVCSQSLDVWLFHKIRDRYIARKGSTKGGRWIWNNLSTMTSQLVDTAIFITAAFAGTENISLVNMIFSQYLVKLIYALLDTVPFYLLTGKERKL